jgi:hypothetical protein
MRLLTLQGSKTFRQVSSHHSPEPFAGMTSMLPAARGGATRSAVFSLVQRKIAFTRAGPLRKARFCSTPCCSL